MKKQDLFVVSLASLLVFTWNLIDLTKRTSNASTLLATRLLEAPLILNQSTTNHTSPSTATHATFFGQPVRHVMKQAPASFVHCIGDMYVEQKSFIYRSCAFRNLCFNTSSKNFVLIESEQTKTRQQVLRKVRRHASVSTTWDTSLALSPVNNEFWTVEDFDRVKWFPERIEQSTLNPEQGYYQLEPSVVIVPFLMYGATNPGHVVWDNFLPIYKLLTMFDLMWKDDSTGEATKQQKKQLLLIHFDLERQLFGMCVRWRERDDCHAMIRKLLPILGIPETNLASANNSRIEMVDSNTMPLSDLVCANNAAAGLGMLSDHGFKGHGQLATDIPSFHNNGKGELVFQFRNFALRNLGLKSNDDYLLRQDPPFRVSISTNSSRYAKRVLDLQPYKEAIEKAFDAKRLRVDMYDFKMLPLREQMRIATESMFYLSACGGSVVTATFLPRGASLILFFSALKGPSRNARLDFDLLNNLPYVRIHWFPRIAMYKGDVMQAMILLMEAEMEALANRRILGAPALPSIQ